MFVYAHPLGVCYQVIMVPGTCKSTCVRYGLYARSCFRSLQQKSTFLRFYFSCSSCTWAVGVHVVAISYQVSAITYQPVGQCGPTLRRHAGPIRPNQTYTRGLQALSGVTFSTTVLSAAAAAAGSRIGGGGGRGGCSSSR